MTDGAFTYDESILSDLYKDAYGSRPRDGFWLHWNSSMMHEKQKIWDGLVRKVEEEIDAEKVRHSEAVAEFNWKIDEIMRAGKIDRETAIVWYVDSLNFSKINLSYGGGYICYRLGLPYEMEKLFDAACKKFSA